MCTGWIKLQRNIIDSRAWSGLTPKQFKAMMALFLSANWEEKEWACRKCGLSRTIKSGETAKSIETIAQMAELNYEVVRKTFLRLEKLGIITIEKPGKANCHRVYRVETLVDFNQNLKNSSEEASDKRVDNNSDNRSANRTLIKKGRSKEVKNTMSEILVSKYGKLANKWMDTRPEYQGDSKAKRNAMPVWLDAFDKLHRLDGLSLSTIGELVDFLLADQGGSGKWKGWFHVCKSPMKLRSKSRTDNIPYHKVILEQMNNNNNINTPLSSQSETRWSNEDDIFGSTKPAEEEKENGKEQILL